MNISELLLQDYDVEMASTRRVLERVPEGNAEYKCHDKSMPLGRLAMHVATLPHLGKTILTNPGLDIANPANERPDLTFKNRDTALSAFDSGVAEVRRLLAAGSDADLSSNFTFTFGEHVLMNGPRAQVYRRVFFNHLLHHRAQLSVYLRLNDIPVPGLYGPSADEPFDPTKLPKRESAA